MWYLIVRASYLVSYNLCCFVNTNIALFLLSVFQIILLKLYSTSYPKICREMPFKDQNRKHSDRLKIEHVSHCCFSFSKADLVKTILNPLNGHIDLVIYFCFKRSNYCV